MTVKVMEDLTENLNIGKSSMLASAELVLLILKSKERTTVLTKTSCLRSAVASNEDCF